MTLHTFAPLILAAAQAKKANPISAFLPLLVLVGVFWFLIMRPQQRKAKEHQALTSDIKQGDRIVAAGGIVGTVRRIDDTTISLQVADNVVIKVDRGSVTKKLTADA